LEPARTAFSSLSPFALDHSGRQCLNLLVQPINLLLYNRFFGWGNLFRLFQHHLKRSFYIFKYGINLLVASLYLQRQTTGIGEEGFTHSTQFQYIRIMAVCFIQKHELIAHRVRGTTDFAH
jgi:hypothetical protein